jgi:hypothetical protein
MTWKTWGWPERAACVGLVAAEVAWLALWAWLGLKLASWLWSKTV